VQAEMMIINRCFVFLYGLFFELTFVGVVATNCESWFQSSVAVGSTKCGSWFHQVWRLVQSSVAVGSTKCGGWFNQAWELVQPSMGVVFTKLSILVVRAVIFLCLIFVN